MMIAVYGSSCLFGDGKGRKLCHRAINCRVHENNLSVEIGYCGNIGDICAAFWQRLATENHRAYVEALETI